MKAPTSQEDAHVALVAGQHLDDIFCWDYTRTIYNDWVIRFENHLFQRQKINTIEIKPKQRITVKRHLNGKITLRFRGKKIDYQAIEHRVKQEKQSPKLSSSQRSVLSKISKNKSHWYQSNSFIFEEPDRTRAKIDLIKRGFAP
jgi:hypothetical protein